MPNNPAADFSPRLDAGGTERPRSRALSFDELAQFFEKIRGTPNFGEDNLPAQDGHREYHVAILAADVEIAEDVVGHAGNDIRRSAWLSPRDGSRPRE